MCTITFVPVSEKSNQFILTSSRDESAGRKTYFPKLYTENGIKLIYPKDAVAGGTWIAVSEKKRVICLMNGGFEKHVRKPFYAKSRGLVLKDLLVADNFHTAAEAYDLAEVEPFTMVVAQWQSELSLTEFVWDGTHKHLKELPLKPYIWSSSPLYSSEMKKMREKWFQEFQKSKEFTPEALLDFHFSAGKGDKNVGLVMDRGFVKTKSVSQIVIFEEQANFYYNDLEKDEETQSNLKI
ncbi:NRDE family protein [Salinimicrobium sp. GXAS 041]|uniref:NRDE family protein n=1 Tax=Salinimicrobium sp. GXAS 041 TaxID=3400806 RepID=UPI003C77558C